jgi:hypothetical protein
MDAEPVAATIFPVHVVEAAAATVMPGGRKFVKAAVSAACTALALPKVMVSVLVAPL